ncbi:MAG: Nramp family divalent metal transporter [Pirellulales bacterium]|nr:Nramp family divalent metal transporter [Pirellulales bacterium]
MQQVLPPLNHKSLPPRPSLWLMLGPGLIWMALAQGSGELIWWPYIIAKYGLAFLFLLIPACLLQFPLTFEIGRYTVLTGEGVLRAFFRLHPAFGAFLWILFTISFFWFGAFASAGGGAIARLTDFPAGWSHKAQTLFWAQTSIVVFTAAILVAKTVYRLIEWVMKIVAIVSLVGMLIACSHPTVLAVLGEFVQGLFVPDVEAMRTFDPQEDATRLLTAITFAGLGGFWTLFYSYWIKEKGAGMASHMQNITGFRSGMTPIRSGVGALPDDAPAAPERLHSWYRYLRFETLVGILGNLATTLMTCLLTFALLTPEHKLPSGFDIAVVQSEFFAVTWGQVGRLLFLLIAGAFLADTWLATVDCVSRMHLDALAAMWPGFGERDQRPWYYGMVLALAVITSVTMYIDQPGPLILISAVIGIVGTAFYSIGLILVNHRLLARKLPDALRPSRGSFYAIVFVASCYLALAIAYFVTRFVLYPELQ